MLSYAWYLYIDHKPDDIKAEAAQSLRLIMKASWLAGVAKKPVAEIRTRDLRRMKSIMDDLSNDPGTDLTSSLYLLKFLDILNCQNLIEINIIDLAGAL